MDAPQAALELVRLMALSAQHRRAASYRWGNGRVGG